MQKLLKCTQVSADMPPQGDPVVYEYKTQTLPTWWWSPIMFVGLMALLYSRAFADHSQDSFGRKLDTWLWIAFIGLGVVPGLLSRYRTRIDLQRGVVVRSTGYLPFVQTNTYPLAAFSRIGVVSREVPAKYRPDIVYDVVLMPVSGMGDLLPVRTDLKESTALETAAEIGQHSGLAYDSP